MGLMHQAGGILVLVYTSFLCVIHGTPITYVTGAYVNLPQTGSACADVASPHYCEMKKADGMCVVPLIADRCPCSCRAPGGWTGMLNRVMSNKPKPQPQTNMLFTTCSAFDNNKVACEKIPSCWYDLTNHFVACYPTNCRANELQTTMPNLNRCSHNPRCAVNGDKCGFKACEEISDQYTCTANDQCTWDSNENFCTNNIEEKDCEKYGANKGKCDADRKCAWSKARRWCLESECSKYADDQKSCNADTLCTWSSNAQWCMDAEGKGAGGGSSTAVGGASSLFPTPSPTPLLPPCAMWGAYLAGTIISDSCGMTSKGIIMPPIERSDKQKSEYETYVAVDKLCKKCPTCKAWMYEPEKRTALLYSSISGQINPGNVFVAGLRSCNKAESPKTVSKDAIAILPKCVQRHTYLVGQVVQNRVGDPHCGTGTGVLPAATVTAAYRKCQFCGGCNAWMWSPQTSTVVMFAGVLNSLHRNNSYYFSAHKGSCKLPMN